MNQEYINHYKAWFRNWQYIKNLNESDIFMYGCATHNSGGDIVILFDDEEQKQAYRKAFPQF